MEKLTLVAVSELAEGEDIREIRWLDASGKGVTLVEDLRLCGIWFPYLEVGLCHI